MSINQFLFSADYGMGIGDFLIKLYAISHLNLHIKQINANIHTSFIIEEYQTNILSEILNCNFFNTIFDTFFIQNRVGQYVTDLGFNTVYYNDELYSRVYSAINDYTNNRRGYWEAYSNHTSSINIDYKKFDYRDPTTRKSEPIPDLNLEILDPKFFSSAQAYINTNELTKFECIYYKTTGALNKDHLMSFIHQLQKNIPDQPIFLTSNSELAKEIISDNIPRCITYNSINISNTDGYGTAHSDSSRIHDLLVEMIIMSYSNRIHYCGNYHYISLFNYYAHMVKKIPLINYLL